MNVCFYAKVFKRACYEKREFQILQRRFCFSDFRMAVLGGGELKKQSKTCFC